VSAYTGPILLIHISDLHFGPVLANNQFRFLSGWSAHDFNLCTALPLALRFIRLRYLGISPENPLNLVISGDLTLEGDSRDFVVAHSYLRSSLRIQRTFPGNLTGLDLDDDHLSAIPGNHDHWDGSKLMKAYTKDVFPSQFRVTPWKKVHTSLDGRLKLELYGIDSNSGLAGSRYSLRAKGKFSSGELTALKNELEASDAETPEPDVTRVRAFVTHHSLAHPGGMGRLRTLELDPHSRKELLELAADYRVGAVLTGHTHDFFTHPFAVTTPKTSATVTELRSAATFHGPAKAGEQGFLCHLIAMSGGKAVWRSWRFQWNGGRYQPLDKAAGPPFAEFDLPVV
jgi:3',5'-cyclic AMP phosphodiesterase CpdA